MSPVDELTLVFGALQLKARYRKLSVQQKTQMITELVADSVNGRLKRGALKTAAERWQCGLQTVYRAWRAYSDQLERGRVGISFPTASSKSGRPRLSKESIADLHDRVSCLPIEKRSTLRSMSSALNIPRSTLHRYVKNDILRAHTISLQPMLSQEQRQKRLAFASSLLLHLPAGPHVSPLYDYVHLDEKWFYLVKSKRRVYLTPTEVAPRVRVKHKSHVPKIMFLCAVARPRRDPVSGAEFDGRIGMWPFAEEAPARRSSRNRVAGTLELRAFPATKETYKRMVLNDVVPAIIAKWPLWSGQSVVLQHDNASPHASVTSDDFEALAGSHGWRIAVRCQPPQSPDLNVLDLGFFASIQAEHFQQRMGSIEEMVDQVREAFYSMPSETLDNTFITLQHVVVAVLQARGGNDFKLPRQRKAKLRRMNALPPLVPVPCDPLDEISERVASI